MQHELSRPGVEGSLPVGKKRKKLKGTVNKVIKPFFGGPEKAQIDVHEADDLYREIRVENVLDAESGGKDKLREGAAVDLIIEADSDATAEGG
jgi:hypothetical protein